MKNTTTEICLCGDEPATATNSWTGEPIGEDCAMYGVKTEPLTVDDVRYKLREAIDPRGGDYQERAIETIAEMLMYQQRRIADLEARVAELTNTTKENDE